MRFVLFAKQILMIACGVVMASPGVVAAAIETLSYGETTRLEGLDPYTAPEAAGQRLGDLLFDSLVELGPGESYVPSLAKSWKIIEGGTAISLTLRDDVYWHDQLDKPEPNAKFGSEDVGNTVRLITNASSEIPNKERFLALKSVEKVGPYQIIVRLNRAMTDPLRLLTFKILPAHILGSTPFLSRTSEFARRPIGTGPYGFVKATSNGEVMLSANPRYFKGRSQIPQIIMKAYADQNVMAQSLMFNSLDLVTYVSPRDLGELLGDNKLVVLPYDALSFSFFAMNTQRGILKDKRVRLALSQAINRQEMIDAFFQGRGRLISGPLPPTSWAYNLDVKPVNFDVSRARAMLQSAGLRYKDNKLFTPSGEPVTLTFAVPLAGESEMIKRVVVAFQGYLEAVGVKLELKFMDWLVWKTKVMGQHDYDVTIASWSFDDASNITSLFHSSSAKPWGNNFVMFKNPEVDGLLTEADATNDSDLKRAIYHKLHALLAEEAPYAYLWTLQHHAAHQQRLSGVQVEPFAFFKYVLAWRMEPPYVQN
ncbi:MAG: hypothetical protein FJ146_02685 [Deltaproteobacteria bacterium]|nr:hypothetical protein [Deltaproteobacteria bacterium]